MRQFSLFLFLLTFSFVSTYAQPGCTDPCANNFNLLATLDDGSCTYTLNAVTALPASLAENSGLVFSNTDLWTHNDGGNANEIYRIDPATGAILQTVTILNGTNVSTGLPTTTEDWEDIAVSPTHIYVGDIGNNDGNRENLKVFRIALSAIGLGANVSVTADVISFTYSDQGIPPFAANPQNNDFDCEALMYQNGNLHLFTKNWVDNQTRHYILPDVAGAQTAAFQSTYNVSGLVTGADIAPNGSVALLGNTTNILNPQVVLHYLGNFPGSSFFLGDIRVMTLGSSFTFGQVEGIAFSSDSQVLISTEAVNVAFPPINITQQVYSLALCPTMILAFTPTSPPNPISAQKITAFPNPTTHFINITSPFEGKMKTIDVLGREIEEHFLYKGRNRIKFEQNIPKGRYHIVAIDNLGESNSQIIHISIK